MSQYDQILQELQEKVARKRKLEAVKNELLSQRSRLRVRVEELDARRLKEQADVDQLENRSLANFFYNVIGKMDEKLDKEREEAYAAAVKYDAALQELEDVQNDLEDCLREYHTLAGVETEFLKVMQAKTEAVKAAGGADAQLLLKLEQNLSILRTRQKEVREALSAGSQAKTVAESAMRSMEKASGYATWDMVGGGLLADMAKYDALDRAQSEVEHLQRCLRRFQTELADVNSDSVGSVNIEGFTRTADYIFDGLFMDWHVFNQISQSKSQVQQVLSNLSAAVARLERLRDELNGSITDIQRQIDDLVAGSTL